MNATKTPPLCDGCTKPEPDLRYMGSGITLCKSCRDKETELHRKQGPNQMKLHQLDRHRPPRPRDDESRSPIILS